MRESAWVGWLTLPEVFIREKVNPPTRVTPAGVFTREKLTRLPG